MKTLLIIATALMLLGAGFNIAALRSRFWQQPPRSSERLRRVGPGILCTVVAVALLVVALTL